MHQPEGFIQKGQEHLVCKLKRSIYLWSPPVTWIFALDSKLKEMGFKQADSDPCLLCKDFRRDVFIAVYVNDILLVGKSAERMKEVKKQLGLQFKVKDMGELSYFLGEKIIQGTIWIGQPLYTEGILKKVGTPVNISEK